jgi:alpha-D-ribose 1-methylphosphonate 5-triphosphate synthase subunit PhnL
VRGAALVGIFHDVAVRDAVADEVLQLEPVKEET